MYNYDPRATQSEAVTSRWWNQQAVPGRSFRHSTTRLIQASFIYLSSCGPPHTVQPWEIFGELRKLKSGKSSGPDGVPVRLIKTIAYELSNPLSMIFNSSFSEGNLHFGWKKAIIVPIPREQPARIDRLRPVALTDHFIKVAEKFMTKWVVEDFGPNLDVKQFGSRSGRSTNHCLVDIVNFLAKNTDIMLNTRTTAVTTDFTSAFDRVDHAVVVSKIILSGCRPAIILWIVDFLCNRTQSVRY